MQKITLVLSSILGLFFSIAISAKTVDFTLTTNAFLDSGVLPVLYTCDGKNISPELSWENIPAKTQTFALILSDIGAPSGVFYHWVLYNIPANITKFNEGIKQLPSGTRLGKNSWNKTEYNGPCPPKGASHKYIFTLYALDTKLTLPAGVDAKTLLETIKNHILQQTQLVAIYSRWLV